MAVGGHPPRVLCKPLGQTGVALPEVGLGAHLYRGGPEPLRGGFEAGALFIDTAESYGTEEVVGQALRGMRDRVFVATKVSPQHFRHADVLRAADTSLRRLGIDCIDLYQLHEPNDAVPIEETMAAMETLVEAGKVRFIGVSNFSVEQMQRAQQALRKHRIVANQVRYNLVDRTIEDGLLAYCQTERITVIAYSPLARGLPFILDGDPKGILTQVARLCGKPPVQVALNWCLCKAPVVVIPKGNSVEHILQNCGASDWRLAPEHLRLLDEQIQWRRRSGLETALRRLTPRSLKTAVRVAVRCLPTGLRRRFN
ncbi:MAG: aldo/keto reductase [Verrucomicrobia bacterium]|nr:aldo/keto reductase [Verrucomicrobiota bacterium]